MIKHTIKYEIPLNEISLPTSTTTITMNNDEHTPQGFTDRPGGPQRGPLLISTSRQGNGTSMSQSPGSYSAQPPSISYRTTSSPGPSPSTPQYTTAARSNTYDTPRSAGYTEKSQYFSKSGSKSPTSPSAKRRSDSSMIDRRVSQDPKTNVYTQCGRHGDQWLFNGFPFDNIKKALERDKKD